MPDEPTSNIASTWQLCTNCERIILRDDKPHFWAALDEHGEPLFVFTDPNKVIRTGFRGEDEFPSLPGLHKSADHCTFCKFLKEVLSSDQTIAALERDIYRAKLDYSTSISIGYDVRFVWNYAHTNEHQFLALEVCFQDIRKQLNFYCTIQASPECKELADWLRLSQPTQNLYKDKATVDWLRSTLSNCSENHDCGAYLTDQDYLPERLIDIQEGTPKLVFGADIRSSFETNPRYLALSYCWGDASHQRKLTRASTQQFQIGIDEQTLSAVHQDTIYVAKALSIPYIWIDSLCILQDDRDDWERQCEQMDKIYGCAYATISAAASTSSSMSFLRRPHGLRTVLPFQSARQPSRNGTLQIELRRVTSSYIPGLSDDTLFDDSNESRLSTRGWAYQERILSTRMILFGEWSVHYLCSNFHQTLNGTKSEDSYDATMETFLKRIQSNGDHASAWELIFAGASIFGDHSYTKPDDILPALSGLARLLQKHHSSSYLAGHWEEDLYRTLLWARHIPTARPKEAHFQSIFGPKPYTVPSWSILDKGYVEMANLSDIDMRSEMQFCVGKVERAGTNPFGAIREAHLEIRSHSFQSHGEFSPPITIRNNGFVWGNIWSLTIGWDNRRFNSVVFLDYHLQVPEISQDLSLWRLVLLGSVLERTRNESQHSSSGSHISQSDSQEVSRAVGDDSEDDQDSKSSNSDASITSQSRPSECSYNSEGREVLDLNRDEGDQLHEFDLSNDQNERPTADTSEIINLEGAGVESDREPQRHPYGLILFQIPDRQEWCRVGIFTYEPHYSKDDFRAHPELEHMTLEVFKEMSQIETIVIL